MAEAVAALGVAANILQFLDYGSRFITQAWRIHKAGSDGIDGIPSLQAMTKDLQDVLSDLQKQKAGDNPGLARLSEDCSDVARRLLASIDCICIPQGGRKRDAIKTTFKVAWQRDRIKELQRDLDGFRQQLSLHLLASLRQMASRSVREQNAILEMLGVETREIKRMIGAAHEQQDAFGMSVLKFLTNSVPSAARSTYRDSLMQDLLIRIYQSKGGEDEQTMPDAAPTPTSLRRGEVEVQFFARLRFIGMDDGETRIPEAYERTLLWVYEDPPEAYNQTWSNFRRFLESNDDHLYWVTGKAGSGKSTLMKFVTNEPDPDVAQTSRRSSKRVGIDAGTMSYQYLSRWSGEAKIYTAVFYFWNSGVRMLTTQVGLFRSVLYQLLSQEPGLVRQVASSRWEALCYFSEDPKDFTEAELRRMLISTVQFLSQRGRVCLFIDGLDEFESDKNPARLIDLVLELARDTQNVKLCISSRPWVAFENAFQGNPSLRLENLTRKDIVHFVSTELCSNANFKDLESQQPDFAKEIAETIVQRSSGVFLWVNLVVSSLLEGMSTGDRVRDLRKRLDRLPDRLEELYEKILLSLDSAFLEDAARYFSIVRHASEPVSILLLSYMDEDCPDYVLSQPITPLSDEQTKLRTDTMRKRLNHRTKGLLEVQQPLDMHAHGTVQYLHRTVKDYIESGEAKAIVKLSADDSYDIDLVFCASYLSLIKGLSHARLYKSEFSWLIRQCLTSAMAVAKPSSRDKLHLVLDEVDRVGILLATQVATNPVARDQFCEEVRLLLESGVWVLAEEPTFEPSQLNHFATAQISATTFGRTFLSLAVKCGLSDYVAAKTNRGALVQRASIYTDKAISMGFKPRVRHSVWPLLLDAVLAVNVEPDMVHVLLSAGADPNFKLDGNANHTPWIKAVEWAILRYRGYFHNQNAKRPWPSNEDEMASTSELSPSKLETFRESIYDVAWSQTEWVQRSWTALYEADWSGANDSVYRKPDPDFLRKPPCRPVIREMIDQGAVAKSTFLMPVIKRMCGVNGFVTEGDKIMASFRQLRRERRIGSKAG
ncbi:hypothetical protein QBC34DRAFT_403202 [Podospora aff. communis PSN243]|uniref:NACHT domain-containing protein n=1 Tax=Podospora aff. communis PSN243 TaxID=3040156 RepID=A0AAV9GQ18_9PEZI|nr:hypothetical protein QBC34DRAFT_403202 [Podospora aff. communis PSN243]